MFRDGLMFYGYIDTDAINMAWKIGLAFWLCGILLVCGLIYLRRNQFDPQEDSIDNALATVCNLVIFGLMMMVQLAAESLVIWWDATAEKRLSDMTQVSLWPWIIGHLTVGVIWLAVAVAKWGHSEIDTFIFQSSFPMAVMAMAGVFLGMQWWPSLFDFTTITSVIMGSQTVVYMILSIPLGFIAIYIIFIAPAQWLSER